MGNKIEGYRELSETEIEHVNVLKGLERECVAGITELIQSNPNYDKRWAAIGVTHLQQGFMAVIRAVARPT